MKARRSLKPKFQTATLIAGVILLLIIFAAGGYILATQPVAVEAAATPEQEAFDRARNMWERRKPSSVRYTVDRDCFCLPAYREPYVVIDRDGEQSFAYAQFVQHNGSSEPPEPKTIEDLFVLLEKALWDADTVTVSYDPDYGFPDNLRIDWREQMADEEQGFYVRDLRPEPRE